jgi:bisphosphoglycerate-dependent phosphoglycerate mutase
VIEITARITEKPTRVQSAKYAQYERFSQTMAPDGKGRLLLLQHTETVWHKLNVYTGWVDVELSESGKTHALQIGAALKGKYTVDKAYTSGLVRAQQTLDLVLQGAEISGIGVVKD